MRERVVSFGRKTPLVGILTEPVDFRQDNPDFGLMLINAGIVHRVGPGRLYVKLARNLAAQGVPTLRFDLSGIGDSPARRDHLPFQESALDEIGEAMDYLGGSQGLDRFILAGICSGANLSYKMAQRDPRIAGAVLINPRFHLYDCGSDAHLAVEAWVFARHYRRIALFSSFSTGIWRNIVTGKLRRRSVSKALSALRPLRLLSSLPRKSSATNRAESDLLALKERGVRVVHVYSEGDEGLDYLHVLAGRRLRIWLDSGLLTMEVIDGADHTFTLLWSQQRLLQIVSEWAQTTVTGSMQ